MEATTQYFENGFFNKQILEYHRPSKFLCQAYGRQNHWFLLTKGTTTITTRIRIYIMFTPPRK
jgi:hypothetical protein